MTRPLARATHDAIAQFGRRWADAAWDDLQRRFRIQSALRYGTLPMAALDVFVEAVAGRLRERASLSRRRVKV